MTYFGYWSQGQKNGYGSESREGLTIEGNFLNNQYHGIMKVDNLVDRIVYINYNEGIPVEYKSEEDYFKESQTTPYFEQFIESSMIKLGNIEHQI